MVTTMLEQAFAKIPKGFYVRIDPITYDMNLQKIRSAKQVTSVVLTLDLGKFINNLVHERSLQKNSFLSSLLSMAQGAKEELNSKLLTFEMKVGSHPTKKDSLDIESTQNLLGSLDFNADVLKEIEVKFKDGTSQKVDKALLRNSSFTLSDTIKIREPQISPTVLAANASDVYDRNYSHINLPTVFAKPIPYEEDLFRECDEDDENAEQDSSKVSLKVY